MVPEYLRVFSPVGRYTTVSFIYAEKYRDNDSEHETVQIFCDTKITPNNYTSACLSNIGYDLVRKYGIVKSTICCPELCISFAGNNILYASKLFKKLKDIGSFEVADVSDHAFNLHLSAESQDDIEFVIAYFSNDHIYIDCIKNGKLDKDVTLAHIGSEFAFDAFQETRLQDNCDAVKQTDFAFRSVVDGCKDDSVGGRVVKVVYDHQYNSFVYQWSKFFCTSKPQTVALGKNIIFHTSASDGGYSYEVIHKDIENVLFSIDQMKPDILYSRRFRVDSKDVDNPLLFGLMMPMLVVEKENGEVTRYQ